MLLKNVLKENQEETIRLINDQGKGKETSEEANLVLSKAFKGEADPIKATDWGY